jgi:hypothetical protein
MLKIIGIYFWPVLIPILLYTAWYFWAKRTMKTGGNPFRWTSGPMLYSIIAVVMLIMLCFGVLIYTTMAHKGDNYTPAEYKNGKLIPSHIE